jgi:DNA-binding MarR family transcriptional regulator
MTEADLAEDIAPLGPGFMLWQVTNAWQRKSRAILASLGLTYVQVVLLSGLKHLSAEADAVSQATLAQHLGADAMMTSQVLRTLETAGLVRRERNPRDQRAMILVVTAEGEARLARALPVLAEAEAQFFDPLGRREQKFLKSLRKLWRRGLREKKET